MPSIDAMTDADLVTASLAGDRDAFAQIVERYQRLLCSLAYSATGSFTESEDIAQETLVAAWRQLAQLREPEKLRSWLCGILRHQVGRSRRREGREPVRRADELDAAADLSSGDEHALDLTVANEEQMILWHALEQVPALYREPLVLYYRENRSIEHVAVALDLTEDTVKQRLARGRKMVQERVLSFVEGALARSTPGRLFTLSVLAGLPGLSPPAQAASLGAAALQGATVAKSAGLAAVLSSLSGVINATLSLRAALDQARTRHERRSVALCAVGAHLCFYSFLGVVYGLREAAYRWWDLRVVFAWVTQGLVLLMLVAGSYGMVRMLRAFRRMRAEQRRQHPERFQNAVDQPGSRAGEYRSRWRLFGVPLVHIRFSMAEEGSRPVFGWIAGGDRAYGLIFAWGTIAVAPLSVGALAVGLCCVGGVGFGFITIGTVAAGFIAVGCASVAVHASAWLSALGWETAQGGGFSVATFAARGPIALALAQHANDPVAQTMLANPSADLHARIFWVGLFLLTVVPLALYAAAVRRRVGRA